MDFIYFYYIYNKDTTNFIKKRIFEGRKSVYVTPLIQVLFHNQKRQPFYRLPLVSFLLIILPWEQHPS